jgi:hypothetical protein
MLRYSKDKTSASFLPLLASEMEVGIQNNIPVIEAQLVTDGMCSILPGTDTARVMLPVGTWAIFLNEMVYSRLSVELKAIWPDLAACLELHNFQKLPYLCTCAKILVLSLCDIEPCSSSFY